MIYFIAVFLTKTCVIGKLFILEYTAHEVDYVAFDNHIHTKNENGNRRTPPPDYNGVVQQTVVSYPLPNSMPANLSQSRDLPMTLPTSLSMAGIVPLQPTSSLSLSGSLSVPGTRIVDSTGLNGTLDNNLVLAMNGAISTQHMEDKAGHDLNAIPEQSTIAARERSILILCYCFS